MSQIETEKQQEIEVTKASTEKSIKANTKNQISENLDMDKEKIKEQLESAKTTEERVKQFADRTDSYWIEAVVSMIPGIWDLTTAIVSSCYLLGEWKRIWLSTGECLKILWYQVADVLLWAIPIIWDIADFFYKGNKYSSEVFSKHLEKLKKAALEKWISQGEIDNIWKRWDRFIEAVDKYSDHEEEK